MDDSAVPRRRILVTDGEQRAALAVVRSLGEAGHACYVVSARENSLAGGSRHSSAEARVPDPLASPDAFVAEVSDLVGRWRIDMIIPIAEGSMLATLAGHALLGKVVIPFPDLETFRRVSDKEFVLATAADTGILVPAQRVVDGPGSPAPADLRFPLVLKPARTVGSAGGERIQLTVQHAADGDQLAARLAGMPQAAYPLLLQERIVGPGVGIFLLRLNGRTLARFSHRRIREKPPSGGVSVYRESIAADSDLVARCEQLLDRLDWNGVAMIEFKLDSGGRPFLMEINGRFWGSLQLAIDSGVDFPALLVGAASGVHVRPVLEYRVPTRSRWLWGDIDQLLARLRHSPERLSLPPGSPSRRRAIADFLRFGGRHDRDEIFRLRDPRPFWRETRAWFGAIFGR